MNTICVITKLFLCFVLGCVASKNVISGLLYVGEEDEYGHFPRAKEASKIIPSVKLITFPKQGHDVNSYKDLVLPRIIEFLEDFNGK